MSVQPGGDATLTAAVGVDLQALRSARADIVREGARLGESLADSLIKSFGENTIRDMFEVDQTMVREAGQGGTKVGRGFGDSLRDSAADLMKGVAGGIADELGGSRARGAAAKAGKNVGDEYGAALGKDAGKHGGNAGSSMGKGLATKALGAIAAAGIGLVAAISITEGFKAGLERLDAEAMILAQVGGQNVAWAEDIGRQASRAYLSGFTSSFGEAADLRILLGQVDLIDSAETETEINRLIGLFDTASRVTGEDTRAIVNAARTMVQTGLVPNAEAALDVITAGQRTGANISEDWLDTLNEYSGVFKQLGLDGESSLYLISDMVRAGARDSDYAADAIKELNLRVREGGDEATDALKKIGLNAPEITKAFNAGGDDARDALQKISDKLWELDDETLQYQVGVALFGTKWEDLQVAVDGFDVSNAVSDLGALGGETENAMDALTETPGAKIEEMKRAVSETVTNFVASIITVYEEPIRNVTDFVRTNQTGILEVIGGIGNGMITVAGIAIDAAAWIVEAIGEIPGAFAPVSQFLLETAANYNLIAAFTPGLPSIPQGDLQALAEWNKGLQDATNVTQDNADAMRDWKEDAIEGPNGIRASFNGFIEDQAKYTRVNDSITVWGDLLTELADHPVFTVDPDTGLFNDETFRDAAAASDEMLDAMERAGDKQPELRAQWEENRQALVEMMTQTGLTENAASDLVDEYLSMPDSVKTKAELDKAEAEEALATYQAHFGAIPSEIVTRMKLVIERSLDAGLDLGFTGGSSGGGYTGGSGGGGMTPLGGPADLAVYPAGDLSVAGVYADTADTVASAGFASAPETLTLAATREHTSAVTVRPVTVPVAGGQNYDMRGAVIRADDPRQLARELEREAALRRLTGRRGR